MSDSMETSARIVNIDIGGIVDNDCLSLHSSFTIPI